MEPWISPTRRACPCQGFCLECPRLGEVGAQSNMSLSISGVNLQGLVQYVNALIVMSQVAEGAAGIAQYFGAPIINPNRMMSGAHRIAIAPTT